MTEASTFPQTDWERAAPESQGIDAAKLDAAMACMDEFTLDEGVRQALVVRNGRMIWCGDDIDNLHPVWSCSKSFTSICLGLMIDDGVCTLDEPLAKYVPALAEHYADATIRHFAGFTVGYAHQDDSTAGEISRPFTPAAPLFAPGKRYVYGMATDVLGHAITRMAGRTMKELFTERIAEPIGMDPGQWTWGNWGEVDGRLVNGGSGSHAKGVWITARQIARVGWLFVNEGCWAGRQLLSREWVDESTKPQSTPDTPPHDPDAWYTRLPGSYGLNWWVNGVAPDGKLQWPAATERTCAIQGNNNNICFVIPEWNMVVVRLGADGIISTDLYDRFFVKMREAMMD